MTTIDWARFRKCPACHAELGKPCRTLSGTVVEGRALDAAEVDRDRPHVRRPLRTGYARAGGR